MIALLCPPLRHLARRFVTAARVRVAWWTRPAPLVLIRDNDGKYGRGFESGMARAPAPAD